MTPDERLTDVVVIFADVLVRHVHYAGPTKNPRITRGPCLLQIVPAVSRRE
jgi:hypothetical protein